MYLRKDTKKIKIGNIYIGGGSPIKVQTMTKTPTSDINATVSQIKRLENCGCEIIRVAVPDMQSAKSISAIKKKIKIPLEADIHFNYKLALESIDGGADKIRINPGNMPRERLREVVRAAGRAKIPMRIGVNVGSLKSIRGQKDHDKKARLIVDSALEYVKIIEDMGFDKLVISLKASDVITTIKSYTLFAKKSRYPLHVGVTEAGPAGSGTIKSAVGIGVLLYMGLGDTIRVSLTAPPEKEVEEAYKILQSLELRNYGFDIISCPTCGRCEVDLMKIVQELEKKLSAVCCPLSARPLKVAVMGCVVNGPGEAKDADCGIAAGKKNGMLFVKGKPVKEVKPSLWVKCLTAEALKRN